MADLQSNKWYLKKVHNKIHVWTTAERSTEGTPMKIKIKDKLVAPGAVTDVKNPGSIPKPLLKKYYGQKKQNETDIIIAFKKDEAVVILDHGLYEQSDIPNKLQGNKIEGLIQSFQEFIEQNKITGKRKRDDSPPPPHENQKWAHKTWDYEQRISASIAAKRVTHGVKDVFKVPLGKIKVNDKYLTRDVKDSFVHDMMQSMLKDLDNDTVVCLTAEGEPIIDNNGVLNEETSFFVLGGTHYISALQNQHKQNPHTMSVVNATIFKDLTDEEIVWLGNHHNKKQRHTREMTSRDLITNFRRLLVGVCDVNIEPPENPPKDWRIKCNSLLPKGKGINSYSPWLAIARAKLSTWRLVTKVFTMHENGEVKGLKRSVSLESHRLWREVVCLSEEEANKVLDNIINGTFTIREAIQDANNRKKLNKLRDVLSEQLDMDDWSEVVDKYGNKVSSEVLLPFARLENPELIPAILNEFIAELIESDSQHVYPDGGQSTVWSRNSGDLQIELITGTPRNPPGWLKANIVVAECTQDDDSFSKDEVRLVIQKLKTRNLQRQLFVVLTSFEVLGELLLLANEINLESEIVLVKEDTIQMHRITDNTLPKACRPVVIFKKTTSAVTETYHLPVPETNAVSNLFANLTDLMSVIKFPADTVVDTTLDVEVADAISFGALTVIGSVADITLYKERLSRFQREE